MFGDAVVGKKALQALGGRLNEVSAGGMSSFARRIMEKQGWSEGKGLGKNEDGMTSHVKVKQREDSAGLGIEEHDRKKVSESWWFSSFDQALQTLKTIATVDDDDKKKKKKRKKKEKKEREARRSGGEEDEPQVPTYEELFRATGGVRLGMRARASQKAKWERTEGQVAVTVVQQEEAVLEKQVSVVPPSVDVESVVSPEDSAGDDDDSRVAEKERRKEKKKGKKRQRPVVEENEDEEEVAPQPVLDGGEEVNEIKSKKTRKSKKKNRQSESEEASVAVEEVIAQMEVDEEEEARRRRKKEKKEKKKRREER